MDYGHWIFGVDFEPSQWFGFIYKITELDTTREYIGKKQFFNTKRKIVKGRQNRKKVVKESNWRIYTSSSTYLNEEIKKKGKDNYRFEIISLHESNGSLHYAEVKYQVMYDVLRERLSDGVTKKYYNRMIAGVKYIPPLETEQEKQMIVGKILTDGKYSIPDMTLEDYEKWLDENMRGENNPMFGKIPYNKNKTFEELHGVEKALEIKKKLSEYTKKQLAEGRLPRCTFCSEETREKLRQANKGKHDGEKNSMYGRPCFYKMTEEQKNTWRENVSKAGKGRKITPETRARMSAAQTGIQRKSHTCPHCGKSGKGGNMKRYHFDNCKLRPLS